MARYNCKINFRNEDVWVEIPDNRGIADVTDGFWVNKDLKWCVVSEVKYYIPASQILLIEKV